MSRMQNKHFMGDSTGKQTGKHQHDELFVNSRCHGNFLENVPIALVLAAVAELNGANKKILNYTLGTLLVLRVLHAELGLRGKEDSVGIGRPIGHFGTQGVIAALAGYSAYLVKGYWGF